MSIKNAIASVAVSDLAASMDWYGKLFGRAPDALPMSDVAEWKFKCGGWLQVYQFAGRSGGCSVTLAVDSLADQIAELRRLGIDPGETMVGEHSKVVMVNDPDGNSIAFAEALDVNMAH